MSADTCEAVNTITVRFYGSLRGQTANDEVSIALPAGSKVSALRQSLINLIDGGKLPISSELLQDSAIASDTTILSEDSILETLAVSILPPVCGG